MHERPTPGDHDGVILGRDDRHGPTNDHGIRRNRRGGCHEKQTNDPSHENVLQ
jgi:hypothetical protein